MEVGADVIPEAASQPLGAEAQRRLAKLSKLPLVTREPSSNPFKAFARAVRELSEHRYLLKLLVKRELVSRYKDSTLGFLWSAIRPLTQLLIYWVVMGKFLGAARNLENFAVFIFAGLTIYGLLSETLTMMANSITGNAGLIKKVYLPREIFPLATIGSSGFNFLIQLGILLVAALISQTLTFGWHLLYAPAAVVLVLLYAIGIGLMLAAWNASMRDVQYFTEVVLMLLMWASPIVYSWTFVRDVLVNTSAPWLLEVYLASPVTLGVLGFQQAFWAEGSNGVVPDMLWLRMLISALVGCVVLFWGQRVFAKRQANFAQEL